MQNHQQELKQISAAELELHQRARVCEVALTWLNTPFHWGGKIKGVGVDCAHFAAEVYAEAGVFQAEEDWKFLAHDWHANTGTEHYMFRVLRHAQRLPIEKAGQPGDIVLAKVEAKVFDQSGILLPDGWVIQAHPSGQVRKTKIDFDPLWCGWEKAFFNPWAKKQVLC